MTFSFETSIGNNGYTGAILIPDDIAAQLATDKIKRVVATVIANDKEITLYAGIAKKTWRHLHDVFKGQSKNTRSDRRRLVKN